MPAIHAQTVLMLEKKLETQVCQTTRANTLNLKALLRLSAELTGISDKLTVHTVN